MGNKRVFNNPGEKMEKFIIIMRLKMVEYLVLNVQNCVLI
jgi:hypothetical protein